MISKETINEVLPSEVIASIVLLTELRIARQVCKLWAELIATVCRKQYVKNFQQPLKKKFGLMFKNIDLMKWENFVHEKDFEQGVCFGNQKLINHHKEPVNRLALIDDHIIAAGSDGSLSDSQISNRENLGVYYHSKPLFDLCVYESQFICVDNTGGFIKGDLYQNNLMDVSGTEKEYHNCNIRMNKDYFAESFGHNVRIYDQNFKSHAYTHKSFVFDIAIDNNNVFSASADWTVKVWSLSDQTTKLCLQGHTGTVIRLAQQINNLFTASFDGTVKIWDLMHGTCNATITIDSEGNKIENTSINLLTDKVFIVGGYNHTSVCDTRLTESNKIVFQNTDFGNYVTFLFPYQWRLCAASRFNTKIIDLRTGNCLQQQKLVKQREPVLVGNSENGDIFESNEGKIYQLTR